MRFYDSQTQAMQRVERLKDEAGYWPGVIGPDRDGHYRLTYDPDIAGPQGLARTGPVSEPTSDRQHPARQAEPEASTQEADLARAEADGWLDADLQEIPGPEELTRSCPTQAELEAEIEADLPDEAEADWGL